MDSLLGMLRALSSEHQAKPAPPVAPVHHLDVFREFLSHLDRAQARPRLKMSRAKPAPREARAGQR
ncbi:MAG: hypothetical protein JWQ51_2872 [Tardiphaga sp.]|nr:hypothetical protein [Tardiphaga sp.]